MNYPSTFSIMLYLYIVNRCIFLCILYSVAPTSCWQYFPTLSDVVLYKSAPDPQVVHSEYLFGQCLNNPEIRLLSHTHLENLEVLGKLIVRGWLDLKRIPTCIRLRATSYSEDMYRNTANQFQMCVPRITYCHSQKRTKYYYYEWYIPSTYEGGMNWDLYFFGPPNETW